jgi:hypothetical protein
MESKRWILAVLLAESSIDLTAPGPLLTRSSIDPARSDWPVPRELAPTGPNTSGQSASTGLDRWGRSWSTIAATPSPVKTVVM